MTDFLRLNGITVPVARGSADGEQEVFGQMVRGMNARAVAPRRARKNNWKVSTTYIPLLDAFAWQELVAGAGHVLSFDTQNSYTSKGMAPVSVAVGWGFTTSSPKYGAACATWTTGNAVWQFFPTSSAWTVCWWLNEAAAGWHHYVLNSAGTKWIDGVLAPGGTMLGLVSVTSGVATFGSSTASKIDDIVALPYLTPASWPAQIYGFNAAFGLLPLLTADGRMKGLASATSVLGGGSSSFEVARGRASGASAIADLYSCGFLFAEQ